MRKWLLVSLLLSAVTVSLEPATCQAEVEWEVQKTVKMETAPLDTAVSADGKYFYSLAAGGKLDIYSGDGRKLDSIQVNKSVNTVSASPDGSKLYLTDATTGTMEIVEVSFVAKIDITGSPVRGAANAPVVIATYSDFQ